MTLAYWTHDLDPFLVKFTETWGIRWYGLAYVAGFLVGAYLLHLYYKKGKSPLNPDQQSNLFLAIIAGVVIGGRLGYFLFYQPEVLLQDPLQLIFINQGGMASHGGFLGVILAGWFMARRYRVNFWTMGDLLATLAPPGLLFGRIANFVNGELWGKPTTAPWAVIFPDADSQPRHPSQLYEATLEGLALLVYTQLRVWRSDVLEERPGQLGGEFLLGYAIARILSEHFREPDLGVEPLWGFLNRGAFLSIFLALAGIAIIVYARRGKTQVA